MLDLGGLEEEIYIPLRCGVSCESDVHLVRENGVGTHQDLINGVYPQKVYRLDLPKYSVK